EPIPPRWQSVPGACPAARGQRSAPPDARWSLAAAPTEEVLHCLDKGRLTGAVQKGLMFTLQLFVQAVLRTGAQQLLDPPQRIGGTCSELRRKRVSAFIQRIGGHHFGYQVPVQCLLRGDGATEHGDLQCPAQTQQTRQGPGDTGVATGSNVGIGKAEPSAL